MPKFTIPKKECIPAYHCSQIAIIITLAHTLGTNMVAEGIETLKQLQQLQDLGCESGQGYLFSPPVEGKTACQFFEDFRQIQPYF